MLNITLRQLRSFRAVLAQGKIANAARILGLTAPAVTLQIKQLEIQAGLTLFDRTRKGLRPTAAGLTFAAGAQAIDNQLRHLESQLDAIKDVRAGSARLGAVSTAKYFAPSIIADFRKTRPGIEVALTIGNRAAITAALRHQDIDVALMGRPPRDLPLNTSLIGDHPLVIAAAPGHPLAAQHHISRDRIAAESFLIREPGSGTRAALELYLGDIPGRGANPGVEMGSNETIKQAAMAGLGIAFISAHTIASELESGRLTILDVDGLPVVRQWFAISRADRITSPAATALQTFLVHDGKRFLPTIAKPEPGSCPYGRG